RKSALVGLLPKTEVRDLPGPTLKPDVATALEGQKASQTRALFFRAGAFFADACSLFGELT
ncbi:MAG TPA: hypothetical protein VKJ45_25380, partial [Blastocatellia bacterium]|nr:hypothetical protein [Blastocatellia bacterium]